MQKEIKNGPLKLRTVDAAAVAELKRKAMKLKESKATYVFGSTIETVLTALDLWEEEK